MLYKIKYEHPGVLLEEIIEADCDEDAAYQTAAYVFGLEVTPEAEYGAVECRRIKPGRYSPSDRTVNTHISEPIYFWSMKTNPVAVFRGEVRD